MNWPEESRDVAAEVRSWVVNKGLGETVLHKAARLQYHVSAHLFRFLLLFYIFKDISFFILPVIVSFRYLYDLWLKLILINIF